MIGFLTFVRREVFRFISVFKQTIVPPIVSSFLYIFIFGLPLGKHIDQIEGMSYMKFLIPGLIMMYTIEGSYPEVIAFLQGYFSGVAKTRPDWEPVIEWSEFQEWVACKLGVARTGVLSELLRLESENALSELKRLYGLFRENQPDHTGRSFGGRALYTPGAEVSQARSHGASLGVGTNIEWLN